MNNLKANWVSRKLFEFHTVSIDDIFMLIIKEKGICNVYLAVTNEWNDISLKKMFWFVNGIGVWSTNINCSFIEVTWVKRFSSIVSIFAGYLYQFDEIYHNNTYTTVCEKVLNASMLLVKCMKMLNQWITFVLNLVKNRKTNGLSLRHTKNNRQKTRWSLIQRIKESPP